MLRAKAHTSISRFTLCFCGHNDLSRLLSGSWSPIPIYQAEQFRFLGCFSRDFHRHHDSSSARAHQAGARFLTKDTQGNHLTSTFISRTRATSGQRSKPRTGHILSIPRHCLANTAKTRTKEALTQLLSNQITIISSPRSHGTNAQHSAHPNTKQVSPENSNGAPKTETSPATALHQLPPSHAKDIWHKLSA